MEYFIEGCDNQHGIAAGPMTPVVNLLSDQSDADLDGLATYIASFHDRKGVDGKAAIAFAEQRQLTNAPGAPPPVVDAALKPGLAIFMQSCINCHRKGEKAAPLGLASTVTGPDPRNAIQIIHNGLRPPRNLREFSMPSHGWMSDQDLANVVTFMRGHFTQKEPWPNVMEAIREVRAQPRH